MNHEDEFVNSANTRDPEQSSGSSSSAAQNSSFSGNNVEYQMNLFATIIGDDDKCIQPEHARTNCFGQCSEGRVQGVWQEPYALLPSGKLPDPFQGCDETGSPCEAAFLSSHLDVKVRVLCSPTNVWSIKKTYSRFDIPVEPLYIDQRDLNTKRMMDLMAVSHGDGDVPLYIHTAKRILREMRAAQEETKSGFEYETFKDQITHSGLTPGQVEPLKQRLGMLESFMPKAQAAKMPSRRGQITEKLGTRWEPVAGQLTIVDLSCPCISPETACSVFNIALGIFHEQDSTIGRVVALDEAHKYMNTSSEAEAFTETLLSVVRLQRHMAARVIISTQEPTVSTALLNLCSVTIVHRFSSPEWLRSLQKHLAGAATSPFARKKGKAVEGEEGQLDENDYGSLFDHIVKLGVGEALLFSPSAIVGDGVGEDDPCKLRQLGSDYLAIRVRQRLTTDGGKSVLAV
ncbi:hypothetical protein AbraCBS73388_011177 [Aspergillus brasiliensis]|uniref:Zona occludens toxin N-terminal domain-containing protein n=1 Tax=Aspergillus brasiliensis TaxID=319629 RepID=A0A9W6DRH0_9EURO|nr:hypothetical protein AbraCBS73388_011177 [Aspergillus brasiliensis]